MNWLSILGDAFWILALAFIGATLRQAAAKIGPEVRVPLFILKNSWRARRNTAFTILFGVPLIVGLGLSFGGRWMADDPYMPLIFFGLKTATAGLAAMRHLSWLKSALRTLLVEGAVKP
jgi:hypothetical protein